MRRRTGFSFGIITALSVSVLAAIAAAQGPAPAPLMVHQLKPNVYWVEGGGGNSGVIIGEKGVIVVDAKTTPAQGKELLEDIAKITPKPVTTVILTHSDGDHVNGLASFPAGITIIAQENNKKEQEEDLKLDGVKVEVLHWAPAHTSGDLVVFLPAEKIVFTGDIITTQPDALIHLEKHGSSEGWVTTAKGIAALNADQFVPGHGDVLTKAAVQKKATDVTAKRAKIVALVKQGKSLNEIKTAVGDPPPAQGKGGRGPGFASFTEVVYQELTKKGA